jgi:hypothetical protein
VVEFAEAVTQLVLEVLCSNLGEIIDYLRFFVVFKDLECVTFDQMVPIY